MYNYSVSTGTYIFNINVSIHGTMRQTLLSARCIYRLTFVIDHFIDRSAPASEAQRPKCVWDFQWNLHVIHSANDAAASDLSDTQGASCRCCRRAFCVVVAAPMLHRLAHRHICDQLWSVAVESTVNLMAATQLTTVRWTNRWRHAVAGGQLNHCSAAAAAAAAAAAHLSSLSLHLTRLVLAVVESSIIPGNSCTLVGMQLAADRRSDGRHHPQVIVCQRAAPRLHRTRPPPLHAFHKLSTAETPSLSGTTDRSTKIY